jgi:hypothetical protein
MVKQKRKRRIINIGDKVTFGNRDFTKLDDGLYQAVASGRYTARCHIRGKTVSKSFESEAEAREHLEFMRQENSEWKEKRNKTSSRKMSVVSSKKKKDNNPLEIHELKNIEQFQSKDKVGVTIVRIESTDVNKIKEILGAAKI